MKIVQLLMLSVLLQWGGLFMAQEQEKEAPYQATATKVNDLVHTKLSVSFNFDTSQLYGEEWVTVTPHFYPVNSLELDAKAMDIHEVKMGNKKVNYSYKNDLLSIELGKTYRKGEEYTIYIKYTANPEKVTQEGSQAISDAKGLYFIDPKEEDPEKPTQIWTQGETESSSCWFPTIDKPNQKTSEEIYITVPDKYLTLSNGALVSSEKKKNMRTDYWKFDKKHAPYLFFMGVGEFAVIKDQWRNIPLEYYVEKDYANVAKDIFGLTPEMIEFFSNRMNYDFPWNKYSQIICRDYVSGAMENTTAVIFGDFIQKKKGDLVDENRAESIIAHELFHHWFGDLVTTESWSNITVNESFANYSEYLWFEHKYGKERAEAHRFNEMRGYNSPSNFEKNLVRFHYASREDVFDGVSYNKGGLILHMLRNYLGDDAFFAGLNKYLKDNEYQAAEAHQLRLSLEAVSGKDLNWFFNQWYFSNGHPKLKVSYNNSQSGKVKVKVEQTQEPLFQFPFAIDIYENGKAKRQMVWVNAEKENEFTFEIQSNPSLINVNADQVLLCDIEDAKTLDQYIYQYSKAPEYGDRLKAVQFFKDAQNNDPKALQALISAMNDKNFELQQIAIQTLDSSNPNNLQQAAPTLEKIANDTSQNNLVRAAAIQTLAQTKDTKYQSLYMKNTKVVSNAIKGASIFGLSFIDKDAAKQAASQIDKKDMTEEMGILIVDQLIAENDTSMMKLFGNNAPFYPFIGQRDATSGELYKKAFDWIVSSDNEEANNLVVKNLTQVLNQYPQTKPLLTQVINGAISLKESAIQKNPSNSKLQEQLKALQDILK